MGTEIGERIKQVRGALNQRDFAERLGVSKGSISQVEQGKAMPGGEFLLRINQEFGVDVTWLLTGMSSNAVPAAVPMGKRQAALLDNYEHLSEEDKKALERTASALAQSCKCDVKQAG